MGTVHAKVENDNSPVSGLLDFDESINIEEPIPKSNIKLNGVRARVDRVHIDGLSRTKDDIIRSTVDDLFHATDFEDVILRAHRVRRALDSMGCFKDIGVFIDVSDGPGSTPEGLEVTFQVKELSRIVGGINTTVSENEGNLVVGVKLPNVLGRGERVAAEYSVGHRSTSNCSVTATKPYPHTEKVVGFYRASRAELVIRDIDIAKRILTTDFAYFYPRGLNQNRDAIEPLLKNLFFVDGDTWRLLRQRMTPAFTSGKLKAMFPLIVERAERLQARMLEGPSLSACGRELDARDLMARYTTDFIGACGFGLDADSLKDENSAFRKLGANIFKFGFKELVVITLKELFPNVFKSLKTLSRVERGIFTLVDSVVKQRNYEPSGRNDFIDLLLECKQKGKMVGESIERMKPDGTPEVTTLELDDELLAAQVFVFFAAGFETSSSATSYTLHELAYNIEVQEKAQKEIDRVLAKYNNKLSYDAIKEMTYLEWCLKEGMRMFPSLGFLIRECSRNYTFEELNLTINKGVRVVIPLQAIQNDPKYFEHPSEFRPERFSPENFNSSNKYVYMPFGEGPRACIGERLGMMQSVAGLAAVLARCSVRPARAAPRCPAVDPASGIVQVVRGGLPLTFLERTPNAQHI